MRAIIVHGFNANPDSHFYPWLAEQLKNKGFDVVVPRLDLKTDVELDVPAIVEQMRSQVGILHSDDILVGHSLGAFIILQYLEAVEMDETPRAVVMVAAPWNVKRPELRRLFLVDLDADVLMWKAREYVVIHSKDDTMVPAEHGQKLATAFKARYLETDSNGHFMDAAYPVLVEVIEQLFATPFEYAPGQALADVLAPSSK